jgi:hypothetical protein
MKRYEFSAEGYAIGTVIVVLAHNRQEAKKLALAELRWLHANKPDQRKLKDETLTDACKPEPFTHKPQVIYSWDGDY